MTVKEFIENYNGNTKCLEIRNYAPIQEKLGMINKILNSIINTDGKITVSYDSVLLQLGREISIIELYTNLEVENIEAYDILAENNLIRPIIDSIGNDVLCYNHYFDNRKNDYIRESNSLNAIINRVIQNFTSIISDIDFNELASILDSLKEE